MNKENKTKRIALVTYNRIGEGQYDNGVIKRDGLEIYIAQNGHRTKWAVQPGEGRTEDRIETRNYLAKTMVQEANLGLMDHTYLYVGSHGSEAAIEETKDIDREKITYVMCSCNSSKKKEMLRSYGNPDANTIRCECGGRETLERILKRQLY